MLLQIGNQLLEQRIAVWSVVGGIHCVRIVEVWRGMLERDRNHAREGVAEKMKGSGETVKKPCNLSSRAQARGADDVLRDSGTETAIPRCLQQFVRPRFHNSMGASTSKNNIRIKIKYQPRSCRNIAVTIHTTDNTVSTTPMRV